MAKLRPQMVAEYLEGSFSANSVTVDIDHGGGSFKVQLPDGIKASDIQAIASLLIARYTKFKYGNNYPCKVDELLLSKVNQDMKQRVVTFIDGWEKQMIQHLGISIQDINKKPLFHKDRGLQNATVIKFSHLNIGGQQSTLKKLGLGVEFIETDNKLSKIYIHRFDNKH